MAPLIKSLVTFPVEKLLRKLSPCFGQHSIPFICPTRIREERNDNKRDERKNDNMVWTTGQLANIANNLHFMGLEFVDHYMARFYFETSQ